MLQTIDQSLDPTYEDLELISPSYLWAHRSRSAAPPSARITTIASNRERDTHAPPGLSLPLTQDRAADLLASRTK